jgi:DNA polymerase beta
MGICKLVKNYPLRRIDIRYMPYESFYSAILYFTGAKDFNRKMRYIADSMGYTLNEYGLFDENGKPFIVTSEKDIFNILGMEYLTPDKRK